MRKVISHLFLSLGGVAQLEHIHGLIMGLLDEELDHDTFLKLAQEDAMILGRRTYDAWAPFILHIFFERAFRGMTPSPDVSQWLLP